MASTRTFSHSLFDTIILCVVHAVGFGQDDGSPVHEHRTWKSANGKFTCEARFIEMKDDEVQLQEQATGKFLSVPLEKLSHDDHEYLKEIGFQTPVHKVQLQLQNSYMTINVPEKKRVVMGPDRPDPFVSAIASG